MEILNTMQQALKTAAKILKWGAEIQEPERKRLVDELQAICGNCETAYAATVARLAPIKNAYSDPTQLAAELRALAADQEIRNKFKPQFLCSQVDHLLVSLHSNLSALKYSIDAFQIRHVREYLLAVGNVDGAIRDAYDDFAGALDNFATMIQTGQVDPREGAERARECIEDFDAQLRSLGAEMRTIKSSLVGVI